MNRRQFLKRAALVTVASLAGYSVFIEPRRVELERVTVSIPRLPAPLDGFTIGVLADLHLGPMTPVERVREAAAQLAALQPDLTVVAGDFTSDATYAPRIPDALAPLDKPVGIYGNWDYFVPAMRDLKSVRLLVNEGFLAAPGLWVAGIDDAFHGRPDIDRAVAGAPQDAVRILLAHEPEMADRVRPDHRIALQISGHSHGGQVRLPFIGPILLPPMCWKYHTGLYQAPACQVYTSRGVGVAHLPIRFLCPPEITLITLTRQT